MISVTNNFVDVNLIKGFFDSCVENGFYLTFEGVPKNVYCPLDKLKQLLQDNILYCGYGLSYNISVHDLGQAYLLLDIEPVSAIRFGGDVVNE